MRTPAISKSSFLKGKQCLKALYLSKKHPELRDEITEARQAVFDRGHDVGFLAQKLFPGGIMAAYPLPEGFMRSIKNTRELIRRGAPILYEAGFMSEGIHCFVDILVRKDGKWYLYEVKSSTEVKEEHIYDTAFQQYVLSQVGLIIEDVSIIYINNKYVRVGGIDINQLFIIESVYHRTAEIQPLIPTLLQEQRLALQSPKIPDIPIGPQCTDPYECDFIGHCWRDVPEYSVFNISNLGKEKKFNLYRDGIIKTTDVPDDYPLSASQQLQVWSDKTGEVHIDRRGIRDFLSGLTYPLYFLDFETFNPAIPLYDHSRPYQQIVFQYSLHILDRPGGDLIHREYLAIPAGDPRTGMMEQLKQDLGPKGDILVYNKPFEESRLREIAGDLHVYQPFVDSITPRLVDLMLPFQQKLYYTPDMRGSYSIKSVLPALVPGFSYKDLEIGQGGDASLAFMRLLNESDLEVIAKIRRNLLEYCKMDTLAMVEVVRVLERV